MAAETAGIPDLRYKIYSDPSIKFSICREMYYHTRTMVKTKVVTACIRKVWLAFVKEHASSNLVRLEVRHIPGNGDAHCIST